LNPNLKKNWKYATGCKILFHHDVVILLYYYINHFFSSFIWPGKRHVRDRCFKCGFPFCAILFALHCNAIFPVVGIPRRRAPSPAPHTTANIYFAHVLFVYETVQCVCGQPIRMSVRLISVLKRPRWMLRELYFLSYNIL